ncbi:hypothetical protein IQ250_30110, partial [Pseudanabaenaceae cyanobacterium LEGE 13415]|nr:hypothetical protein [Pseudanabaenaceae cyanobacterium LEGE 13415]
ILEGNAYDDAGYELDGIRGRLGSGINGDDDLVIDFLNSNTAGTHFERWHKRLEAACQDTKVRDNVIRRLCMDYFEGRVKDEVISRRRSDLPVRASFDVAGVPWVVQGNLFAAVVSKDEKPPVLLDRLCQALQQWAPSPLQVMLVHARAELEKAGLVHDARVLKDPLKQAGWLLKAMEGTAEESVRRLGDLYGRLFEGLLAEVQASVGEFGAQLINGEPANPLQKARDWARIPADVPDHHVYHAANEFLSSDEGREAVLTTGIVFRRKGGKRADIWVCTTPACDLVPNQNKNGWDGEIYPFRAVTAARIKPISKEDEVLERLTTAARGRNVFLTVDGQPTVFEVEDDNSRQMKLQTVLVEDEGKIHNSVFKGQLIKKKDGKAVLEAAEFEVVARLRSDYANRFLIETGQQKSRIGVDWIN